MPDERAANRVHDDQPVADPDQEMSIRDTRHDAPGDEGLVPSTAPGSSFSEEGERTGGADAVPMTPVDDGRAGREDDEDIVTPPSPS